LWNGKYEGDDSGRSFFFTLRNPRGVPLRKFALRAGKRHKAICCYSAAGPLFGNSCTYVSDNCNANADSSTQYFGDKYESVSGGHEGNFLTGAQNFKVKEIEVFEIAD
jgi:hypothetical protein